MLSGATWRAAAIVGTAVFRIVVSSDSMKNATAISQGSSRLLEPAPQGCGGETSIELCGLSFIGLGCIGLRKRVQESTFRAKPIIADRSLDFTDAHAGDILRDFPRAEWRVSQALSDVCVLYATSTNQLWIHSHGCREFESGLSEFGGIYYAQNTSLPRFADPDGCAGGSTIHPGRSQTSRLRREEQSLR